MGYVPCVSGVQRNLWTRYISPKAAWEQPIKLSEYISAAGTPALRSLYFYIWFILLFFLLFLPLSSALESPSPRRTPVGTNFLFSIWRNRNSFLETKKICYFHSHLAYRTASRFFVAWKTKNAWINLLKWKINMLNERKPRATCRFTKYQNRRKTRWKRKESVISFGSLFIRNKLNW